MGLNEADRLKSKGIPAKKGSVSKVPIYRLCFYPLGHPLWHPREDLPLDEKLIAEIMEDGVTEPIVVLEDGNDLFVIDGARRTMNGREAERRLHAEGRLDGHLYVDIEIFNGTQREALAKRLKCNSDPRKLADAPSVLASTFIMMVKLGATSDELLPLAPTSMTLTDVNALLRWQNLSRKAAAKFDSGEAPIGLLTKVLDAKRDNQEAVLEKLLSKGVKSKGGATRALNAKPQRPHPKTLVKVIEIAAVAEDAGARMFAAGLDYALGNSAALDRLPVDVATQVRKVLEKKRGAKP